MDNVQNQYKANGKPFTTKDRNNQGTSSNYAVLLTSAWWYSSNSFSDLNEAYTGHAGHMYWDGWSRVISKSVLMIKRTF